MPATLAEMLEREAAAQEDRAWVRLTSTCNNRCLFCLDSVRQDGGRASVETIKAEIRAGRERGATRLVLSGGEATIHKSFVSLVAYGRSVGFSHVQTITNGRMFSYPRFLSAALAAGLSEITFSMHGHTPELHDKLVGVRRAFVQALQGLDLALGDGRPIVNVDVCLNRYNIDSLPEILEFYMARGVREFDLLHLIPFGRAYEQRSEHDLYYDIEQAAAPIGKVLQMSRRPDLHIWLNRFPPPYLEGFEDLIQDPDKLLEEARGAYSGYEAFLAHGKLPFCHGADRCRRCYMEDLCETFATWQNQFVTDAFEVFRIDVTDEQPVIEWPEANPDTLWIRAPDVAIAVQAAQTFSGSKVIIELDSYAELSSALCDDKFAGKSLVRAYAASRDSLDSLLALGSFEVVAYLSRELCDHLLRRFAPPPKRLVLARRNHRRASDSLAWDADICEFFANYTYAIAVDNVPACMSGQVSRPEARVLESTMLRPSENGEAPGPLLDVFGCTETYIRDHFYTKSRRCRTCMHDANCRGIHINHVRAHGYTTLCPPPTQASTSKPTQ